MIATLQFDLATEREDFTIATKAPELVDALLEFADLLRQHRKYETAPATGAEMLERLTTKFYQILDDRDINLG
jgi:hypothetical protein